MSTWTDTFDARAVANRATGSANLLYKHLAPETKPGYAILEGRPQADLTDEEALRQAEMLREAASDLCAVLAARVRA